MPDAVDLYVPERACESEVIVKKSRFIGRVQPINSADGAEQSLAMIRDSDKAASHHCFAYTVGWDVPVERFSDDGEPSGTAGKPILEVLRRRMVRNTLVVVTRYFGGVLLGAGGLTRSYAESAADVLNHALLLKMVWMRPLFVVCDYTHLGKLEHELTKRDMVMHDKAFADDVRFTLWAEMERIDTLIEDFNGWTAGRIQLSLGDTLRVGVRPDGSFRIPTI